MTTTITPFLWFNDNAEEAARFYTSVFPNSKITAISHYGEDGPGPKGSVMTVDFTLDGNAFTALNGGPQYTFTEAVSFMVYCATQEEVDRYWERLTAGGGKPVACGWLKDRFGLSWQITPTILMELLLDKDKAKVRRVMQAMMQMVRLDIRKLQDAAAGR